MNLSLLTTNKNFKYYFYGQAISRFGDSLFMFAIVWFVLQISNNSALLFALAMISMSLPEILFSVFGGTLGDKFNKKNILIIIDILSIIINIIVIILTIVQSSILLFYLIFFIHGMLQAIWVPNYYSFIPTIVDKKDLTNANGFMELVDQVNFVIGPILAGFLVKFTGLETIYVINTLTFIISISLMLRIIYNPSTLDKNGKREASKIFDLSEVKEGLSYIKGNKIILRLMLIYSLSNFVSEPFFSLLIVLVKDSFENPLYIGILNSSLSIGLIIGSLVSFKIKISHMKLIILSEILMGILMIIFIMAFPHISTFLIYILIGVILSVEQINVNTLYQLYTKEEVMGKIMGIRVFSTQSLRPISKGIGGYIADRIGVKYIMLISGLLVFLNGLIFYSNHLSNKIQIKEEQVEN
ncbi:MFS transporter [Tepidibacillus infernus]|uniref:Transmembrane secretion effector n=1 Tax=Tepidibacillus fermentans TaxID=1281767 RepID=A0A4V2US03_9BACI|nr:MFS transporter [Tepidibacillus fermentans]TCS79562.1 transmembrane secretion effector [Tepidibacillus fermentans]